MKDQPTESHTNSSTQGRVLHFSKENGKRVSRNHHKDESLIISKCSFLTQTLSKIFFNSTDLFISKYNFEQFKLDTKIYFVNQYLPGKSKKKYEITSFVFNY